jgi:hypothetical protein
VPIEADTADATADDQRWTADQRREFDTAADEVLDSLEPYIAAARPAGGVLPWRVLTDPEIASFLQMYSGRALASIRGTDLTQVDGAEMMQVIRQMLVHRADRMGRLFGGPFPRQAEFRSSEEQRAHSLTGALEAGTVLNAFDPKAKLLHEWQITDDKLEGLQIPENPKATRLHPDGPRVEIAKRLILRLFSRRLVAVAAGRPDAS